MKIRKAMEKAKQARADGKSPNQVYMERAAQKGEWTPPVYTESRPADVDPLMMRRKRCVTAAPDSPYLDAFKVLRTRINNLIEDKRNNALMITSAMPGEGKTMVAINLALAYAKEFDQTVLLVDCDFHRQDVHKYLGVDSGRGLVDYLIHEVPLKDLIIWPKIEKMTFISGGDTIQESTELLSSSRMRSLVEEIKARYPDRFIIFDVPPVLAGADAIAFAGIVDSIVMVVRQGRTSMDDLKKAVELIPREKFLGFVMNRDPDIQEGYGYGYGST
jgi:non-specific protein-tyrosine kinase